MSSLCNQSWSVSRMIIVFRLRFERFQAIIVNSFVFLLVLLGIDFEDLFTDFEWNCIWAATWEIQLFRLYQLRWEDPLLIVFLIRFSVCFYKNTYLAGFRAPHPVSYEHSLGPPKTSGLTAEKTHAPRGLHPGVWKKLSQWGRILRL